MSQRHSMQNGVTVMVTTVMQERKPIFANAVYAHEAIECLYRVQDLHPFFLYAFVIMPDHAHIVMRVILPESISNIIGFWKGGLAHDLGLGPIWQPRFHIRYLDNPYTAIDYVHSNPLRKGLAECPEDYPWSSASGRWDVSPILE